MMRSIRVFTPMALTLLGMTLLTACSGEPSESDIKTAIQSEMDNSVKDASHYGGQMAGDMVQRMMPKLYGVHKIGCTKEEGASYICDVEIDAATVLSERQKKISKMHFIKGSDGWMMQK